MSSRPGASRSEIRIDLPPDEASQRPSGEKATVSTRFRWVANRPNKLLAEVSPDADPSFLADRQQTTGPIEGQRSAASPT